jgi:hypothetical protein
VDDFDQDENERIEAKRRALLEEENQYQRLARVFGNADGLEAAEWVLNLSGYWSKVLPDERTLGRFDVGRTFFNELCLADINIAHNLLDRRRKAAELVRTKEKRALEKRAR